MRRHTERHRTDRIGWLRAAVLGANDGIVSTASLLVGVVAAQASSHDVLLTGVAALVAGAMSMAAGEYVSVRSQADTEAADLAREKAEIEADPAGEHRELTGLYTARGLTPELAHEVAGQLMAHDALSAHARDELGITASFRAQPVRAALASAAAFAVGAALPLGVALIAPQRWLGEALTASSLVFLAVLGAVAASTGGAAPLRGAARVSLWGALAMAATAAVGALIGASV